MDARYSQIIDDAIEKYAGEFLYYRMSEFRFREALKQIANTAFTTGKQSAIMELKTTVIAAAEIGISPRRVRALAKSRGVGWQISRGVWLFRPEDVGAMRVRIPGKPPNR